MASNAPHEAMDLQTVADLLRVSTRHINNYINHKGLPSQGSGRTRTFVWGDVLEWYVNYRLELEMGGGNAGSESGDFDEDSSDSNGNGREDIRAANLRKTKAEANLKELQLGKLRGQVVSIPDAKVRLDRMMSNLRAKLLAIAPKLSGRIEAERDRNAREAVIRDEMENLCREISTGAIVDVAHTEDGEVDELEAAADIPAALYTVTQAFQGMTPRQALREANDLVRAAKSLRDRVKEYIRARVQ